MGHIRVNSSKSYTARVIRLQRDLHHFCQNQNENKTIALKMEDPQKAKEKTKKTTIESAKAWGGKLSHTI